MTVLVTTDGSDRSWAVIPHAMPLANALSQPMRVIRVLNPLLDVGDEFGPSVDDAAVNVAGRWAEDLDSALAAHGVVADTAVEIMQRRESTEDTIMRVAEELDATVLAMNSRGQGLLRHALIGSTAMACVGKSGRPVLLTGPNAEPPANVDSYRVVITNDASKDSDGSVAAFAALFAGHQVEIVLLSVYTRATGDGPADEEMGKLREHLQTMRDQFTVSGSVLTRVIDASGFESTDHAIVRGAEELEASAIAMASHGHSVVRHLFAGSTALGVLRRSSLGVLMVPV